MHERQRIREAVVALLDADVTIVETVEDSRAFVLKAEHLPRILVYSGPESNVNDEPFTRSPLRYLREMELTVELARKWSGLPGTSVFAELESMLEKVELALSPSMAGRLAGSVQYFGYRSCTPHFSKEGEVQIASLLLGFTVHYVTEHAAVLFDYTGADVDYNLQYEGGSYPEPPQAEDTADV